MSRTNKRDREQGASNPRPHGRGLDTWFVLAFLAVCLTSLGLSVILRQAATAKESKRRLQSARESAMALSQLLERHFQDFKRTLQTLATTTDVPSLSKEAKRHIDILYKLKQDDYVVDIAFLSSNMKLLHSTSSKEKIGADVSEWPHSKRMMAIQKFDVSSPFKEAHNAPVSIAVQTPVFKNGEFVGALRFLVDFSSLLTNFKNFTKTNENGDLWIFDSKISLISSPQGGQSLKITKTEYGKLRKFVLNALKMETGVLPNPLKSKEKNSHIAFNVASLAGGGEWVVCVMPKSPTPLSWMQIAASPSILVPLAVLLLFTAILATLRWRVQSRQTELFGRALETRRELLDEANARLSTMLESMPYIIFEVNPDGAITFFKPAPKDVLGYHVDDKTGMNIRELAAPGAEDRINKILDDLLLKGASAHALRVNMELAQNIVRTFSLNAIPGRNANGEIVKINGIMHDITSSVTLEESLEQSQKMDTIGAVASGVAHDFNNYLTTILGYVGLMKMKNMGGDELLHLEEAAKKAGELTERLLTFSRPPKETDDTLTNLAKHIPKTVEMVKKSFPSGIKLDLNIPKKNLSAKISNAQLDQVLMNLLVNARDATGEKGHVAVKLWETDLDTLLASRMGMLPGQYAVLEVTDTGRGFSEEVRRRMFEPYFTTKKAGTGLGLAGAYMIVKNSGGNIIAKSSLGKGAKFYVYLPLASVDLTSDTARKLPTPELSNVIPECAKFKNRILLVEDRELIAKMISKMFSDIGCEPILAADGTEGVKIFKRRGKDIGMIVSDIMMDKMDGLEMVERIRKIDTGAEIPVLFISGQTPSDDAYIKIKKLKAEFLRKPFNLSDFLKKIKNLTGGE